MSAFLQEEGNWYRIFCTDKTFLTDTFEDGILGKKEIEIRYFLLHKKDVTIETKKSI